MVLTDRRWLWVAASLWLASCSCSEGAASDAGDAVADTRPSDAGDTGRDSRPDSRRDSAADAAADTGPMGEAGWTPLPGLPDGCVIERAENPAVLFVSEWVSCGDGCEYLAPEDRFQRAFDRIGWHDGERGWFAVIQDGGGGRRTVVFAPTDGPAIAAWRGPNVRDPGVCQVGPDSINDDAAAFGIRILGEDLPEQFRIYHAPLSEIGRVTTPIAVRDPSMGVGSRGVQTLSVSQTTVAALVQPAGVVIVFEDGAERVLGGPTSATPGNPQRVQVQGRAVWWEEWGHPTSLVMGSVTAPAAYFLRNLPDDAFVLELDGREMGWLQGYDWGGVGAQYSRVELWTAAYTEDPLEFRPRLVREVPSWDNARMGGGVYGFKVADPGGGDLRVGLYDLADGRQRGFRTPAGGSPSLELVYVTAEEMLLKGRFNTRPTLFRVQLSSLPYEE